MNFLWPVDLKHRISSGYGKRVHPVTCAVSFHSGIDIACPQGSDVVSPCDGFVVAAWIDKQYGGGRSVIIESKDKRVRFGFAHLSSVSVENGASVRRGQVIALSGGARGTDGAGSSTGPHLHMTVRMNGARVDPVGDGFRTSWEEVGGSNE